jgi:hypothetical protein
VKVGFPLLLGLIALAAARAGGMPGRDSLVLATVVAFGSALILFILDTEARISAVDERMAAGLAKIDKLAELSSTVERSILDTEARILAVDERMAAGFAKIGKLAELSTMMERSILDTELLTDFLETASRMDGRVNPLLQRLARREIERATTFIRQLPVGGEITYEGEDRDWLLGLAREARQSIDAISLSTVDAGLRGFDGGLWTSDLGTRYLELQREAIVRGVRIRRIFVFENEDLAHDETFLKITQMQSDVGVEVRMLDHQLIPDWMQSMIFDFIVFDRAVSYETTPATTFTGGQRRPAILRTLLAPMSVRVNHLEDQFEQLWNAADPERPLDE